MLGTRGKKEASAMCAHDERGGRGGDPGGKK